MAGNDKSVELRIKAILEGRKSLDDTVDALKKITSAQDSQITSAKKGEVSLRELEGTYKRLRDAADGLLSQNSLIEYFQNQSKALADVGVRADSARTKLADFNKTIAQGTAPTKEQKTELAALTKEVKTAEGAQVRLENRLAGITTKLESYGIAVTDIAGAQARITQGLSQFEEAFRKQDAAIQAYDEDLRAHKATLAVTAEAERAYEASLKSVADAQARAAAETAKFNEQRTSNATSIARAEYERTLIALFDEREKKERELAAVEKQRAEFSAAMRAQKEKELATQRQEVEAANALRLALRQQSDQIAAAVKGYENLARATKSVSSASLASSLRDIIDPASAVIRTMGGVEQAVAKIEKRAKAAGKPVKEFKASIDELNAAQKSIGDMASSIDGFRRQAEALRNARSEYTQTRTAVAALVEQMRQGTGGENVARDAERAKAAFKASSEEMARQIARTRELRDALRATGVDTSNLAAAEAKLVDAATRSAKATNDLTASVKKYGQARDDSAKKASMWATGERTTLSFMQRMRGEVLALTATYVGLNATIALARGSLEALQSKAKIESRLSMVFDGDMAKVSAEWAYLEQQATRLNVSLETAALGYSKFAVAAQSSGMSLQEIRFIFEGITQAARTAGLSNEEYEGTLKAVEQMMSKGVVQAEELKGQLGDRLPGAVSAFARAAGKTVAELLKEMEKGGVTAKLVVNLAKELGDSSNSVMDTTASRLRAASANFESASFKFKIALAENGFADAYSTFLNKLATLMSGEQGAKLARALSDLFEGIIKLASMAADNIDTVKYALAALAASKVMVFLVSLGGALATAGRAFGTAMTFVRTFTGAIGLATAGMGALRIAGIALGGIAAPLMALWGVWEAGKWILDKFTKSANEAAAAKRNLANTPSTSAATGSDPAKIDPANNGKGRTWAGTIGPAPDAKTPFPGGVTPSDQKLASTLAAMKADDDKLNTRAQQVNLSAAKKNLNGRLAARAAEYDAPMAEAKSIPEAEKRAKAVAAVESNIRKAQAIERKDFAAENSRTQQSAATRTISLAQEVASELKKIEDDLVKRDVMQDYTKSFDERLKARKQDIGNAYSAMDPKIVKLQKSDPKAAADARSRLDKAIAERKDLEERKARTDELARLQDEMEKQQSEFEAKKALAKANYDAGATTEAEYIAKVSALNVQFGESIGTAATKVQEFADSMLAIKGLLDPSLYEQIAARIGAIKVGINPGRENKQLTIDAQQAQLDRQVAEREAKLKQVELKQKNRVITSEDAAAQTNAINATANPAIQATGNALTQSIDGMITKLGPNGNPEALAGLEQMRMKVEEIVVSAQKVPQAFSEIEATAISSISGNSLRAVDALADSFGKVVTGQMSVKDGLQSMAQATTQAIASMLKDVAMYILKLMIIRALESSGNPYAMAVGGAMRATSNIGAKHGGGMAGSPSGISRSVHPGWFAGAQRLHDGGIPGLSNNEVPTVLLKNEEVLTRNDPRHVLNGGKSGGGGSNRLVLVDDRAKVAEAMTSAEGETVTLMHLRRNIATVKQYLEN